MLLGRTLRVLLWAAFCHCCVAQYCAAYCRWDIMNCRTNAAACGACEICRAPGAQAKIAAVIAAKEIRGDEDGPNPSGVVCEAWCNAEVAKSHCINKVCKPCDFCQNYNSACEHWCKPDRGHCPDERCSGCAKCAEFSKAPQKLGAPAQAPALAPGIAAVHTQLECYALRYPDLLDGFCQSKLSTCNWERLKGHYDAALARGDKIATCDAPDVKCFAYSQQEVFEKHCDNDLDRCRAKDILLHVNRRGGKSRWINCKYSEAKCYAERNPDLIPGFCKGSASSCDAMKLFKHWLTSGRKEGREYGCNAALSPPPPPAPLPAPLPAPRKKKMTKKRSPPPMLSSPPPSISPASLAARGAAEGLSTTTLGVLFVLAALGLGCIGMAIWLMRKHQPIEGHGDEEDEGYDEEWERGAYRDTEEEDFDEKARRKKEKKEKKKKEKSRRKDYYYSLG